MIYVILIIVGIIIISTILRALKEFFLKLLIVLLIIGAAFLLIKGAIWAFHAIGGLAGLLGILKVIGIIIGGLIGILLVIRIISSIIMGIQKAISIGKIKRIVAEVTPYLANMSPTVSYQGLLNDLTKKYGNISVKPYNIDEVIQNCVDRFEEANIVIIDDYIENTIKSTGMQEYNEFYSDIYANFGEYCVKSIEDTIASGIEKYSEVIEITNGYGGKTKLAKAIGATNGNNFVSREINLD